MSRIRAFLAAVVLVGAAAAAPAAEYDLAAYLAKVERDNIDLALARQDVEAAKQSVVQARSALLPTVAAQAGYTRNFEDIIQSKAVAAPAGGGALITQDMDTNFDNELTYALAVNQKIFDAAAIAGYSQAKQGLAVRRTALEIARRSIRAAAKKVYAQTQLTAAVVEVMEASQKAAEETYKSVSGKFKAGVTTELELLMSEVDWKSRIPTTAQAKRNAELAMAAFKNLANIPLGEKVALTEKADLLPEPSALPPLETVLASRPDYTINLMSAELADIARKAAYGTFLPSVSGSYTYARNEFKGLNMDGYEDFKTDASVSQVGIKVTVPLFTGFYRTSLMQSAKIAQTKAALETAKKRDSVERELADLRLKLDETRRRIDSARLVEAAASRAAALARSALANGLSTQVAVSEAAAKHDQARLGVQNAIFEYRAAYYDWQLAIGAPD
jgi:outer membrane protein TolC